MSLQIINTSKKFQPVSFQVQLILFLKSTGADLKPWIDMDPSALKGDF